MTKTITLLTGNKRKEISFRKAIEGFNIKIAVENPWLPEIQDGDTVNVAAFAAKYGANLLKKPVVKIDAGFYIKELKGFPGTLVHTVDKQIGVERFFEILKNLKSRESWIKISLAYCEPGKNSVIFNSKCRGIIVNKLIFSEGSFIDRLFIPHHVKNKNLKTMGQIRKEYPDLLPEVWGSPELQFAKWFASNSSL